MISIAIFNEKGGVGKSTSVVNIASTLAQEFDKKVLILDCDKQCNATDYLLKDLKSKYSILDYFEEKCTLVESISDVSFVTKNGIVCIIPGDRRLNEYFESNDSASFGAIFELMKEFDYCLIDCPGSMNAVTNAVLDYVNFVLVPALADLDSLKGYSLLLDSVAEKKNINPSIKILGVFFNNVENFKPTDSYMIKKNTEALNKSIFISMIRRSSAIQQARMLYLPVCLYKNSKTASKVSKDYIKLVQEIITRIELGGD